MKRVLFALAVVAGLLGYLANPSAATPTNTTINVDLNGCHVAAIYGNFGNTAYATMRLTDTDTHGDNCWMEQEAVFWASGGSSSKTTRLIDPDDQHPYIDTNMPTSWQQVTGPISTGYAAEFCVQTSSYHVTYYTKQTFRWDLRFNDGASAGLIGSTSSTCTFTAA
jgi:hypothetical protein